MCGRFSQSERVDRIAELFGADPDPALAGGSHNVAPTDPIRIVVATDGRRRLISADWGFRPFWRGHEGPREAGWINARAETAPESPAFGPALRKHRCVIPADAFYEWDRGPRPPQPYAIGAAGGGPLAMAGLFTRPGRDDPATAAILTTGPNGAIRPLHDRMPVLLDSAAIEAWLAPDATLGEILPLLVPAPDDALRIWPVSTAVNKVGTDGPELLMPIDGVALDLGLARAP